MTLAAELRAAYAGIEEAQSPALRFNRKAYREKYGAAPGGEVEEAKEQFIEKLLGTVERLEKRLRDLEVRT